jgi:ATP-dependent DNA helicase RecQ
VPILKYFGESFSGDCGACDNCARKPLGAETLDVTEKARLFLTCVRATGEMFGPAHVTAVLRGSRAERILDRGHDALPCYGKGAELTQQEWRKLLDDFLRLGLVEQDLKYGGLRLTASGRQVLAGKQQVKVFHQEQPTVPAYEDQQAGPFEQLKALRRQLASAAGIPAYMVFSDATLLGMARMLPETDEELLQISGVGEAKLRRYGRKFLAFIRNYRRQTRET